MVKILFESVTPITRVIKKSSREKIYARNQSKSLVWLSNTEKLKKKLDEGLKGFSSR